MKSFLRLSCILSLLVLVLPAVAQDQTHLNIPKAVVDNVLDTPAVQSQISKLYSTAGTTLVFPGNPVEFAFTVRVDGEVSAITSSHDRMQNHLRLFEGDVAVIHTHPAGSDPRPSKGDILVATTKGVPNYELSKDALWVAMPDGTFHKVASVQYKHGGIILIYEKGR